MPYVVVTFINSKTTSEQLWEITRKWWESIGNANSNSRIYKLFLIPEVSLINKFRKYIYLKILSFLEFVNGLKWCKIIIKLKSRKMN